MSVGGEGRVISTCPVAVPLFGCPFVRPSLCSAVPLFGLTLMTSLAPRPRAHLLLRNSFVLDDSSLRNSFVLDDSSLRNSFVWRRKHHYTLVLRPMLSCRCFRSCKI